MPFIGFSVPVLPYMCVPGRSTPLNFFTLFRSSLISFLLFKVNSCNRSRTAIVLAIKSTRLAGDPCAKPRIPRPPRFRFLVPEEFGSVVLLLVAPSASSSSSSESSLSKSSVSILLKRAVRAANWELTSDLRCFSL